MSIGLYDSSLNGPQMDTALEDMANHTSERYAKGTVNGVPVSSGMGYHDNAKYYADQAASVIPGEYTDAVRFDIDQTNIKSAAEKAQARANIACGSSNRNLLDNGWFGSGVINQRGKSSYSGATDTYTIDRWKLFVSLDSLTVGNGYITVYNFVGQKIENVNELNGKTLTASILLNDGTLLSGSFTNFNASADAQFIGSGNPKFKYYANDQTFRLDANASVEVKAVKLELGSVSTLANDVAPDTASELAKCRRYCKKIVSNNSYVLGYAIAATTQIADFYFSDDLRNSATPTLSMSGLTLNNESNLSASIATINTPFTCTYMIRFTTTNALTVGSSYAITGNPGTSYIMVSADL